LEQPDGADDVERELQVLRLPVLEHVDAEARRSHITPQADRITVMGGLVGVEVGVADERLHDERAEESVPNARPRPFSRRKRFTAPPARS
jgi:hypothetical protein